MSDKSLVTGLPKFIQRSIGQLKRAIQSEGQAPQPDLTHPSFDEYESVWQKCRDAAIGQRAIRAAGQAYLPALAGQTEDDYLAYLTRASFLGATGRTIEAMTGAVFRKPMIVTLPDQVAEWAKDISLSDESLTDFAMNAFTEVMEIGRGGIFVDSPQKSENVVTVKDAEQENIRPYLVYYYGEQIINWEVKRVNNATRLFNVWLLESYQDSAEVGTKIRQLTLEKGFYQQVIWTRPDGETAWKREEITPTNGAKTFDRIPFFPVGAKNNKIDISEPPLESLVDINISHYLNSADYENGCHVSGIPTLVLIGSQNEMVDESGQPSREPVQVGTNTAIELPIGGDAKYISAGENGFQALENAMEEKKGQMAQLGAQLLMPEKKAAEAQGTAEIRRGGQNSVLASISSIVSRQIVKALEFAAAWESITGEISVELNKDYFPVEFTPAMLTAWVGANQQGRVSDETFWEVMRASEWIPDGVDYEEEQRRRDESGPSTFSILSDPANEPEPKPPVKK